MHFVTESLVVGNLDDAKQPSPGVGGLLFLAEEHDVTPPPGIAFTKVPLKEFAEADPVLLNQAVDWLEQQPPSTTLMICCRAGMGRSVSAAIAFLCCVKGMGYREALLLLKARRPGATPLPSLEQTIGIIRRLRQTRAHEPEGQPRGSKPAQASGHDSSAR